MVFHFSGKHVIVALAVGGICIIFFGAVNQCQHSTINPYKEEPSTRIYMSNNRNISTSSKQNLGSAIDTNEHVKNQNGSTALPHVLTYHNHQWKRERVCKPYKEYNTKSDFQLHNFKTNAGTVKIFTYDTNDYISAMIIKTGAFEVGTINRVLYELQKDNRLNLIDIGTNIGQHSIAAALIGRESLAVDGAQLTLEHLCASVQYLNMHDKITMIYNIMSDSKGKRNVRYSATNKDFGGTFVETDDIHNKKMAQVPEKHWNSKTIKHDAVTLDDFLDLPQINRFRRVFIKMDVEGHEHKVLQGGMDFFKKVHIAGIVMEWIWHKNRESGNFIRSFMEERGYKAYDISRNNPETISGQNHNKWPQDVLWLPQGQ